MSWSLAIFCAWNTVIKMSYESNVTTSITNITYVYVQACMCACVCLCIYQLVWLEAIWSWIVKWAHLLMDWVGRNLEGVVVLLRQYQSTNDW